MIFSIKSIFQILEAPSAPRKCPLGGFSAPKKPLQVFCPPPFGRGPPYNISDPVWSFVMDSCPIWISKNWRIFTNPNLKHSYENLTSFSVALTKSLKFCDFQLIWDQFPFQQMKNYCNWITTDISAFKNCSLRDIISVACYWSDP